MIAPIESIVRAYALRRLASVFHVDPATLLPSTQFGKQLTAGPKSFFGDNEYEIIDRDIKDVADKSMLQAMARGELEIRTVSDYCDHILRSYYIKPVDVARLLSLPAHIDEAPPSAPGR